MTTESRMREALEKALSHLNCLAASHPHLSYPSLRDEIREALSPPARRTSEEDRIRALESLVRAADRMREGVESAINSYRRHELDGWEIAVVSTRMQDYDTQRAAVGEIEGD